jgi:hypothetical protein
MKTKWPTIRRRVYPSGLASFQVDLGELNGKRERHTFGTKEEAESFAEQARVKRLNEGLSAFAISQELRVDALNASGLLQGRDVSLTGGAEYYLKHAAAYQNAPKIPAIVARMLTEAESNQRRGRTVEDLRARLNTFAEDFKEHRLGNLTVEDIQEWVIDDDWQPRTRINYLTKISQLMNFGIRNGWIETNIAERIPRPSVEDAEPKIFTVEQAQILLDNAQLNIHRNERRRAVAVAIGTPPMRKLFFLCSVGNKLYFSFVCCRGSGRRVASSPDTPASLAKDTVL